MIVCGLALALIVTGCASTSHVVTGTARPACLPEAVKVYEVQPTNAVVIGAVSATEPNGFEHVLNHPELAMLKKEAAAIGANGIVLGQESEMKFFTGWQWTGIAIFVP